MTPEYFYLNLRTPITWKPAGWNTITDTNLETGEDEPLSYGKLFDDRISKIIRISFCLNSEFVGITERTKVNGKMKYKTVCDVRTVEELNEYIKLNY